MSQGRAEDTTSAITAVFCDTGIFINYVNQEWERDHTTELLEEHSCDIVVSETVKEEFESVTDRREDVYMDLLGFILEEEGDIEEFSPSTTLQGNDHSHIQGIQFDLASEDRREVARRLRRFGKKFSKRAEKVTDSLIDEVFYAAPPFMLSFDLQEVIDNENDSVIVAEAADWTNEGGSGYFVTLDKEDLLELSDAINEVICEEFTPDAVLHIVAPDTISRYSASDSKAVDQN